MANLLVLRSNLYSKAFMSTSVFLFCAMFSTNFNLEGIYSGNVNVNRYEFTYIKTIVMRDG